MANVYQAYIYEVLLMQKTSTKAASEGPFKDYLPQPDPECGWTFS